MRAAHVHRTFQLLITLIGATMVLFCYAGIPALEHSILKTLGGKPAPPLTQFLLDIAAPFSAVLLVAQAGMAAWMWKIRSRRAHLCMAAVMYLLAIVVILLATAISLLAPLFDFSGAR